MTEGERDSHTLFIGAQLSGCEKAELFLSYTNVMGSTYFPQLNISCFSRKKKKHNSHI